MKDDWKEGSRAAVNDVISLAQYKRRKYRAGISEESKKELEKARNQIPKNKDLPKNEGGK